MSYRITHRKSSMGLVIRIVSMVVVASLIGCTTNTYKDYQNTSPKNVVVRLSQDSDLGVTARLSIHRVNKKCRREYLGTVQVTKKPIRVGIPNGRLTLLAFYFVNKDPRWYMNETGTINVNALVKPRRGYRYDAKLIYENTSFEVKLYEINKRSRKRRALNIVGLNACKYVMDNNQVSENN